MGLFIIKNFLSFYNCDFAATILYYFYVNEKNEAIIECSKCRSVFIMSSKDSHLYEGPLHAPITFAVHPIPSGAEFVRAICTDYDGNISWTQAIWL